MNSNSHKLLTAYLTRYFLQSIPDICKKAFQLGCSEPDKNPATYLKGSVRGQLLRGHNWKSTQKCVFKIGKRLEDKPLFTFVDYYCLGRLIHYTADAFTYAHNSHFCNDLKAHRHYERELEKQIVKYLSAPLLLRDSPSGNLEEIISHFRIPYLRKGSGVCPDSDFIKIVCSEVMLHFSSRYAVSGSPKNFCEITQLPIAKFVT